MNLYLADDYNLHKSVLDNYLHCWALGMYIPQIAHLLKGVYLLCVVLLGIRCRKSGASLS